MAGKHGFWRPAWRALLDVAFPPRCVQCAARGAWICPSCEAGIHWLKPPLCLTCGREIGAGDRCQECARTNPRIAGVRAACRYEHAAREAIHRLKYSGQTVLAEPLSAYLAGAAAELLAVVDVIVPVPLHPSRRRARGYNQSELLARALGRRADLPVEGLVERVVETEDQVRLTRKQRQENVARAFSCPDPDRVAGRSVLLVDDVCTTGSTLFASARPLYRAKAAQVWAVAVARQDAGRE